MSNLEVLIKAYVEFSLLWNKAGVGENSSRFWASCRFLEKLIRKELEK